MNHKNSITVLLAEITSESSKDRPARDELDRAVEHVADCPDCWRTVETLHRLAMGEALPEGARMRELLGCTNVQRQLEQVADLTPEQIKLQHPALAEHLARCRECSARFREMVAIEQDETFLAGPPLGVPREVHWEEIVGVSAVRILKQVEQAVIVLREGVARFVSVPPGFAVATANLPVTRHEPRGEACIDDVITINRTSFPLGDSGLRAEVKLTGNRRGRAGLEVHVIGQTEVSYCVSLYRGDGLELVEGYDTRGSEPVRFQDVPAGTYTLEICPKAANLAYRLQFTIESAT